MSVIEATSAGVRDMSDGSLRITFEFEPRHAAEAFALFGPRGRAVAVAALKDGSAQLVDTSSEHVQKAPESVHVADKPKGGALAKLAGMWCNDEAFCKWLTEAGDFAVPLTPTGAAEVVRDWCQVDSRADLDHRPKAGMLFERHFRGPYMKHQIATGATT